MPARRLATKWVPTSKEQTELADRVNHVPAESLIIRADAKPNPLSFPELTHIPLVQTPYCRR
ncbi:hypothetical protein VMCG_10342 [Cytospora schulzeri]|uniref:Uncharacterized protein n=1 Tax=Cytospora schulzeri TaxID=448051 RepID=A0A423VFJ3_9PEZI|nr:hypothetical protein VMCG_10342 [Valsa malicola]